MQARTRSPWFLSFIAASLLLLAISPLTFAQVEEPPIEEPPIEEPPVEEPPIEEPPVEEPPVEEPPVEEPPAEQISENREVETRWAVRRWIVLDIDRPVVDLGESNGQEDLEIVNANTVTVMSNAPWVLTVQATTDEINYFGEAANPAKPVSDFYVRARGNGNGNGEYVTLAGPSGAALVLTEGNAGMGQARLDYRVDINETDPVGEYGVTLLYTASVR